MFYVYLFQNNINLKVYVGKSNNPKLRLNQHLAIVKNGKSVGRKTFNLIHKAISKYGGNSFTFQVIEEFEDEKKCLEAEKFWIEFFRADVNKFGSDCGYNLTVGGDGLSGRKHTLEAKAKIGKASLGRRSTGIPLSEDTKKQISNSLFALNKTKIIWPKDVYLLAMVKASGYTQVGKVLNVSDNAVRGRLKRRKLI